MPAAHAGRDPGPGTRDAQNQDWRRLWREAVTDPRELLALVGLQDLAENILPRLDTGFALRVPRSFVARMRAGDARDPLLLQVLPQAAELEAVPGFGLDAVGDLEARTARGVLHKYHGRALLVATGSCAVNCRYCFRRHFPYGEETAAANRWHEAIEHLRADTSIEEVILSGGDPLSLSTAKLAELTRALADVAHIRRLRIHTRLPIVLPERIDAEFTAWLRGLRWPVAIVLHANHANELDASVAAACALLREAGATLLNQSVLLRAINDSADALAALSKRLFDCGVLPYYLHQLDRVAGAAHFAVDDDAACALVDTLRVRLPGYLVPRLVREIAHEAHKVPL
ncbi:EF-P beta-lysylation protein EpmB [Rudaea sp.]|uniref:EF-P beta-lysylation protein EpmB n=1 Tax=Rudaea sp. TaxID=2136325 RepID=UPI0032207C9F